MGVHVAAVQLRGQAGMCVAQRCRATTRHGEGMQVKERRVHVHKTRVNMVHVFLPINKQLATCYNYNLIKMDFEMHKR